MSFDTAEAEIKVPATSEPPLVFLNRLLKEKQALAALSFCAYMLPRRECVWWATQAIRHIEGPKLADYDDIALLAAEAWVREPGESRRKAALRALQEAKRRGAGAMCARAAGWSGGPKFLEGSLVPDAMAAPHETAAWCRKALLNAIISKPAKEQTGLMAMTAAAGARFAAGEALAF